MKTSELTGPALDWAVAKADGLPVHAPDWNNRFIDAYNYSTDWAKGGPIIEREGISLKFFEYDRPSYWGAVKPVPGTSCRTSGCSGPTPLIAAMRCYVASKLGDEVEVPEELR